MKPGKLRHRVTLQTATTATDSFGEPDISYSNLVTVWADVRPLGGSENVVALHQQGEIDHLVTIRYSSVVAAITGKDRVKFGTRVFDIKSIRNPDERNIMLELTCKERVV